MTSGSARINQNPYKTVSYQYDASSNRTRLTYPDSTYITYDYDELSRMTAVRNSSGTALASYNFDDRSRRTGLTYANGAAINYSYDTASRLSYIDNQTGNGQHKYSYMYDNVGNRTSMMVTDGSGVRTHVYSYDNIYQITAVDYPSGFDYLATDTTFNYAAAGNRTSVIDGSGTSTYTTNNLNEYTAAGTASYQYDASGNMTHDNTYAYGYDPENRLVAVQRSGSLPAVTLGQALESPLTYTTGGDAAWTVTQTAGHGDFDAVDSGYLGASQSNWLQTTVQGAGTFSFWWKTSSSDTASEMYFYIDGTARSSLTGDQETWQQQSYTITGSGTHTLKWTFTRSSDENHNGAGFVDSVQWTGSTLPAPEPPTNAWRRLTYTYDPSGRRIAKSYDGELITSYVYDGDNCIAEYDINSNLKRKYIYGPGVDQPICMMEATASPAATYYYHFDALGSVVALTNSSGNTVEVYEYSVFGQVGASDANHPNRFMFTGREFDKETGLYYYRARYYNPQIGRFLQTDPVGYGAGMNLYRYCRNNPLGLMDPSGCDPCDPCDANQTPSPVPYGPSSGEPVITPEDIASGDLMGVLGKIAATPATILGGAVRMAQAILADIASHTEVAFYVVGQNGIVVPVKVFQSRSKVNGVPGLKDVAMNLGNEIHIGPEMAADLLTEAALRRSVGQVGVATPITWGGPTGTNYEQTMAHELGHQVDADRMGILYPLIGGIATLNQTSDFEQRASNLGEYYGLLFPSEAKALGLI